MNTPWKSWTLRPGKLIFILSDWGIQWTVLGVARQFYTIRERKIIAKQRSGEYALSVIPVQRHRIIKEAIRIRAKDEGSLYRFRFARMVDAVDFMKYIFKSSGDSLKGIQNGEPAGGDTLWLMTSHSVLRFPSSIYQFNW